MGALARKKGLPSGTVIAGHLFKPQALDVISDGYLIGMARGIEAHPEAFDGSSVAAAVRAEMQRRRLALVPASTSPVCAISSAVAVSDR